MSTTEKNKKLIPEPPAHIKVFNTRRKPKRRKFLPWVAQTIISWPDLKKRGAKLTRTNMEELDGKPYLLLINHASKVDLNMMYKATHPQPLVNVMTIEGFRDFTLPLMDLLGVIGLGEVEAVLERFVAERLLDWIQVLSLEVLRRRHRGGRKIIGLDERDAYLLPAGDLRGAETALA